MSTFEIESQGFSWSEAQERVFDQVEKDISELGKGYTREMARSQGSQLVDNIKSVEMNEDVSVSEKEFGRRLCTNIRTMFLFVLGNTLKTMVETNYPIDRYIRKKEADIQEKEAKLKEFELVVRGESEPEPYNMDYYMALASIEWNEVEQARQKAAAKVQAPRTLRSTTAAQVSSEGEVVTGATDLPDVGEVEVKPSSRHPSPARVDGFATEREYRDKHMRQFVDDSRRFKNRQQRASDAATMKKTYEEATSRSVVIVTILDGVRSAMNTIVNKVKTSVALRYKVKAKLCGMITLEKTGELVVNPFESNNLSGIFSILTVDYYTPTLVQFNRDFSDLLRNPYSPDALLKDPLKAVTAVDKRVAEWILMNYSKFMTMDVFMVNILLMYLPSSPFKDRCVVSVTEFIQSKEDEFKPLSVSESGVNAMPIYQHLVEFMKVQHNSVGYLQFGGANAKDKPRNPQGQYGRSPAPGMEHANVSEESTLYKGDVTRDKNIVCTDPATGHQYPYTAIKALCGECHGDGTKGAPHAPRCFKGICYKCQRFGHRASTCKQDPSSFLERPKI